MKELSKAQIAILESLSIHIYSAPNYKKNKI
jgi:hypothetical protein